MSKMSARLFCLGTILVLFNGGNADTSSSTTPASRVHTAKPPTSPATLDLIIGGPFAFVQESDSLIIWIPNVKKHSKPFGLGLTDIKNLGDRPREFDQADYDFTKGIRASAATTVLVPVQDAGILVWSRKKYGLSDTPKKTPYLTIKLPIPREIVPWNADPITVSDAATGSKLATTTRLSTMTILRYDFQPGDAPEMVAKGKPTWAPKPFSNGSENVLLLAVLPPNPGPFEDEHKHARAAFSELTKLVSVRQTIGFPSVANTRNSPLVPGVLPDDLLEILVADVSAPAGALKAQVGGLIEIFGKINDCKSSNVLVAP
jgi:hypothetical protein